MNKRVVIALGHSALGKTFPEQKENAAFAAEVIADIIGAGYDAVITHSNSDQIGMIHSAMTEHAHLSPSNTVAPVSLCSAMSQGYIGFDLQNEIRTALLNKGLFRTVSTIITQVRVDAFDPAFGNPTKMIGNEMDEQAAKAEEHKGNYVKEVAPGVYRRIVAAPKPLEIYEADAIKALVNEGQVVIACGGGGIPVLQQGTRLKGASAVIEKDLAAEVLAECIKADVLLFLTGVDKVCLNFGKEDQEELDKLSEADAERYIKEGQFTSGSMLPKVRAALDFASSGQGRKAVITSLPNALKGLEGKTGTVF
ncbi:MAG: carbamate kinase [Lachnospiraceae bacterium]|jgi:carbamate kinase|nr:carbamate kinase [Lachnospiraceae bacterium]MEE3462086.1 carbamate kinase [Lachnospiraceae bacterium]